MSPQPSVNDALLWIGSGGTRVLLRVRLLRSERMSLEVVYKTHTNLPTQKFMLLPSHLSFFHSSGVEVNDSLK